MKYFAYFLRCADGSLYAGYTTDIERRVLEHNTGTGAKYTSSKRPVELIYSEEFPSKSMAMKREAEFKSWKRAEKLSFLASR